MAKSKKTKIHKKTDGQLLQMNKSFNNLKMKQKDKITAWVYEEYKKYVTENEKVPDSEADEHIIDEVLDKINEAQIWIPSGEIVSYYYRKKVQFTRDYTGEVSDGRGAASQIFHVMFKLSLVAAMVVIIKSTTRRLFIACFVDG